MTPQALATTHASAFGAGFSAAVSAALGAAFTAGRPWSATEFAALLAQPGMILTGTPQGFLLARVTLDEAEILTLATHPDQRRQGLARAALTAFEARARAAGAHRAFLEVAEDNAAARALYAQAGFAPVGRRPGYFRAPSGPPVAALILRKSL